MGVFTSLDEGELRALLETYDLGSLSSYAGIPAGSVNSNFALELSSGKCFLRIYEEQDAAGARAEARLLTHLASHGVPTPSPVARRDDSFIAELSGKPAAIFPWRDGEMICQRGVTEAHAAKVGEALARVHREGEAVRESVGEGRFRPEDLFTRIALIEGAADPTLAAQAPVIRAKLTSWLAARDPDVPRGVIHGDLFRDNVLWASSGEVSALLDFESASTGPFVFDVMVTVLSWCFGDTLDARLARAMVTGYRTVRELDERERAALLAEGCFAALRFETTRITDYAMRAGVGPRVMKDWRRFARRLEALEALGVAGLREALGV